MSKSKFHPSSLVNLQPGLTAFAVLAVGFMAVALSFFWGVGVTSVSVVAADDTVIVKEAGYGAAFNWSVGLSLLLPAALLYLCKAYRSFLRVVRELAARRMVLGKDLKPVPEEELRDWWTSVLDSRRRWLIALVVVGTMFSLWEWWDYSAHALWADCAELAEEWDWSVGSLLDDNGEPVRANVIPRVQNGVLSLIAFLGQSLMIAVVLAFVYQTIMASTFFSTIADPEGTYRLVPEAKSGDPRRGFNVLSDYLEHSLILVTLLYFLFYLSRIQNIYLRSDAETVLQFIRRDLLLGLVTNPLDLGATVEVVRQGLDPTKEPLDYSSIMVSLAAFGVMMAAAFMIGSTVREAARSAKRELLTLTESHPRKISEVLKLDLESIKRAMKEMVFWPVNYLRASQFFGLVILGVFCIFFYKLGVILLAFVLLRIFWEVAKYIWGKTA